MSSNSGVMRELVEALKGVFRKATHKRAAHYTARPILEQASRDLRFFSEALAAHLSGPEQFNRLNYPVISVPVTYNPYFELVVNCWIPLPTAETDVTTKAIHHHGDMLLSTATIFGPGYEHWMFTRPRAKHDLVHTMSPIDVRPHRRHEVAFVDDHVPHVPLYPKSLSMTLALWSSQHEVSFKDRLKRVPLLKRNARVLRAAAVRLGLRNTLDLKLPEYFDFFPVAGGFEAMKDRKEFELGPNEDHLHSLFHVIAATDNAHLAGVIQKTLDTGLVNNRQLVESLSRRLAAGEAIEGKLSRGHFDIPFANYRVDDIKRAVASQSAGGAQHQGGTPVELPHAS
jgi:hypothetical protein